MEPQWGVSEHFQTSGASGFQARLVNRPISSATHALESYQIGSNSIANRYGFVKILYNNMLKLGKYRHYKGNNYEVIGVAKHSETQEELVVYRALYGEGGLWARPLKMFTENVEVDGKVVPRFEYIGE